MTSNNAAMGTKHRYKLQLILEWRPFSIVSNSHKVAPALIAVNQFMIAIQYDLKVYHSFPKLLTSPGFYDRAISNHEHWQVLGPWCYKLHGFFCNSLNHLGKLLYKKYSSLKTFSIGLIQCDDWIDW